MNMQESDFRRALESSPGTTESRCRSTHRSPITTPTSIRFLSTSNASVLKQLHEAGFSMSMTKKGLEVSKY